MFAKLFTSSINDSRSWGTAIKDEIVSMTSFFIGAFRTIFDRWKDLWKSVKFGKNFAPIKGFVDILTEEYTEVFNELNDVLNKVPKGPTYDKIVIESGNLRKGKAPALPPKPNITETQKDATKFISVWEFTINKLGTMFAGLFKNMTDGFADSLGRAVVFGDDLAASLKNVAKNAIADLISGLVKLGIQQVVLSATGAAAAASSAGVGVAAAHTLALAYAPAASLASLASFGGNAIPASAGISSTSAIAEAIANKGLIGSALPGKFFGGYTGNKGVREVAGYHHGQEFVTTASATKRNRPALEAMNKGATFDEAGNRTDKSTSSNSESRVVNNFYSDLFSSEEVARKFATIQASVLERGIKARR